MGKSFSVDALAAAAHEALSRAQKHSADIEASERLSREAWRDFGQALLDMRRVTPSNNAFGAWVKANGLDQGLASDPAVRSNAMWLAENWDVLVATKTTNHNPTQLRQECRDLGLEWAFAKGESKKPAFPFSAAWKRERAALSNHLRQSRPRLSPAQVEILSRADRHAGTVHEWVQRLDQAGIVNTNSVEALRSAFLSGLEVVDQLAAGAVVVECDQGLDIPAALSGTRIAERLTQGL